MKKNILSILLFAPFIMMAQNEVDVLRYSYQNSFSTARSAGMGGAFGSLGADLSSLSLNPAGLGLYRRGEFSFNTNFGGSNSNTAFNGNTKGADDFHFKLNSIGFVTVGESDNVSVNKVAFSIGYNQLANYNESFNIIGDHSNSILDLFADQMQGIPNDYIYDEAPSYSVLAWDAYLVDTISGTNDQYQSAIPYGSSTHNIQVDRNGGLGELALGGAVNVSDRFYTGFSIGFPIVHFSEDIKHRETPTAGDLDLEEFTYTESLDVSGSGVNLKVGVILKPTQKLRIGAAVHTGTIFSLTDTYSRGIKAKFKDDVSQITPDDFTGTFDYRIKTPARYFGDISFIAGKSGVISADYEYIDYSRGELKRSTLSGDTYTFDNENATVNRIYRGTHNVRAGMELRIAQQFRVRAGTKYMQSPYAEGELSTASNGPTLFYTGGFGYRTGTFFVDVGAVYSSQTKSHYAYSSDYISEALIDLNRLNVMTALGWRF